LGSTAKDAGDLAENRHGNSPFDRRPESIWVRDRDVAKELDPGITVDIAAGRFRFDVYAGREKSEELEAGNAKFGGGVSFRVKPIFKTFIDSLDTDKHHDFLARAGYVFRRGRRKASVDGVQAKDHAVCVGVSLLGQPLSFVEPVWLCGRD
jgi:hypothetical protein